jgi:hypothetical protein
MILLIIAKLKRMTQVENFMHHGEYKLNPLSDARLIVLEVESCELCQSLLFSGKRSLKFRCHAVIDVDGFCNCRML